jgi:D-xylose 1-dehydrogenase (NADP+, D-xylono-1,5-lactone-forming)
VTDRLRFGVLGAARIADVALLPALAEAGNAEVVALASRDGSRARAMADRHAVPRWYEGYDAVLEDPDVDAVYVALANGQHHPWTLRALAAGKHVLCEKPLACTAAEGEEMVAAAAGAGRLLMEAVMYRFHPRMRAFADRERDIRHLQATFAFPLRREGDPRLDAELGGGALLDVGCYCTDVARWLLGEPDHVQAVAHRIDGGVDLACIAALSFPGGRLASLCCSFESPEHQELVLAGSEGVERLERPFTAWRDPDDPYRLMVEAFSEAVVRGEPSPLPNESSLANLRLLDRIRAAAELPGSATPDGPKLRA